MLLFRLHLIDGERVVEHWLRVVKHNTWLPVIFLRHLIKLALLFLRVMPVVFVLLNINLYRFGRFFFSEVFNVLFKVFLKFRVCVRSLLAILMLLVLRRVFHGVVKAEQVIPVFIISRRDARPEDLSLVAHLGLLIVLVHSLAVHVGAQQATFSQTLILLQ